MLVCKVCFAVITNRKLLTTPAQIEHLNINSLGEFILQKSLFLIISSWLDLAAFRDAVV